MITNRDKINKMTNEELAKFFLYTDDSRCRICSKKDLYLCNDCEEGITQWLNEECEDDNNAR